MSCEKQMLVRWRFDRESISHRYNIVLFFDDLFSLKDINYDDLEAGDILYVTMVDRIHDGPEVASWFYIVDKDKSIRQFPDPNPSYSRGELAVEWNFAADVYMLEIVQRDFDKKFLARLCCSIFRNFWTSKINKREEGVLQFLENEYDGTGESHQKLMDEYLAPEKFCYANLSPTIKTLTHDALRPKGGSVHWRMDFLMNIANQSREIIGCRNNEIAEFIRTIVSQHDVGLRLLEKQIQR